MKQGAGKKQKLHVNLDSGVGELLDAVAARMGQDPLYPTPSRSDLLNKAARLFISECKKRPELKEALEAAEARQAAMKVVPLSTGEKQLRPKRPSSGERGERA